MFVNNLLTFSCYPKQDLAQTLLFGCTIERKCADIGSAFVPKKTNCLELCVGVAHLRACFVGGV
jgi:hypothetical protein